jgi:phosphatidylglycerophosphatase C
MGAYCTTCSGNWLRRARRHSGTVSTLAVFDLDGTITRHDSMLPFVFGYLLRHPWRSVRLPLALPAALMYLLTRDRGALKGALLHAAMGGLPRAKVDEWATRFVTQLSRRGLFAEALTAITTHRRAGDHLVLMSASVDCYVPLIARSLGFNETICSQARWRADGRLDGRLTSANVRGAEKARHFRELLARLKPTASVAYGNSTADLPHMLLATRGVFVNGTQRAIPDGTTTINVVLWHARSFNPEAATPPR